MTDVTEQPVRRFTLTLYVELAMLEIGVDDSATREWFVTLPSELAAAVEETGAALAAPNRPAVRSGEPPTLLAAELQARLGGMFPAERIEVRAVVERMR